jgi:hypothetical protein
MKKLKWLAALPDVGGMDYNHKTMLIRVLDRNGDTVESLVKLPPEALTKKVEFALQCDRPVAATIAEATVTLLNALIATADSPPSEAQLKKFIRDRQLQMQPESNMMGIYEALTSDDLTYNSFTMDPITGKAFDPVWLQLAIETMYKLPPR